MTRIKMHISKVKLPFYPLCEIKCGLQNGMSTNINFTLQLLNILFIDFLMITLNIVDISF